MDAYYGYPDDKMQLIRDRKAWVQDPKYFKRVRINPSASIKMMMHGQQGVEKGIAKSGKPIEVMGLLLGRPDIDDPNSFVISDALPIPAEGFETRVIVDDDNVSNYMIELGDSIELSRKERFCGWYHTHPFDLDGTSHCYLSNTDISTQLQWQRTEDPHGNPWLAIVIDPLYSLDKGRPEMMAFRVYPPEYSAPPNETPDGTMVKDDHVRVSKWGACWNRYYKLDIEYYMSELAQDTLGAMNNQLLWHKPFTQPVMSHQDKQVQNLANLRIMGESSSLKKGKGFVGPEGHVEEEGPGDVKALSPAAASQQLADEHTCAICNIFAKKMIFCREQKYQKQVPTSSVSAESTSMETS